ncbi:MULTISPECIES: C40 family peptidase [Micromonospora]|uniref:C40 family peptidase n=1 Tax=Micromonospora antibiotica TaxID=2807623 RepID=A0ABS3VB94_9ACTN|nr:C40 family peptidase [Micromonospora antibiotica]MBO4162895.1 C40 family peptidase [Micromonospora antibiotica]
MSSLRMLLRTLAVAGLSAALIAPSAPVRAEPSVADLTARIERSSAELERIVESYNKLNEEIKTNQATAAGLHARIGPLEAQAAQSRAAVGQIAATAYKTGGLRTAEAILDPAGGSLVDRLGTLDQLTRHRQQQIDGYTADQRALLDQKARLDSTLARQAAQSRAVAKTKKRIEQDLAELYEMRRAAYGRATEAPVKKPKSSASADTPDAPAVSGSAGAAVRYAYGAIGKPYVWGAEGPNGYDCSGLTLAAWRSAGKRLPHNAAMQWNATSRVSRGELRPGDLVFYSGLGHVALYVGDGQVIDAPSAGRNVLKRKMNMMSIAGYGRVR